MERDQLADFLRRRREAIHPGEVGLAQGPRRRSRGLRREEVAMFAGISVDYVARLEQGRSSQPSTQLLGALARALRLSDDERDHLFHLAGHRPPPTDGLAQLARAGLVRMMELLTDTSAVVLSDLGEVLAQNPASLLLMGDQTSFTGDRRYLVYRWFTDPAVRATHPPGAHERHARELVADLRTAVGRHSGDSAVAAFVARLQATNDDFRRMWAEHEVAVKRTDRKTLIHPRVGELLMDVETLAGLDHRQRLMVLTPADNETRERLELLRVLGIQEFTQAREMFPDRETFPDDDIADRRFHKDS
ncbi:transcriptional regulator with XRE-family HTH domain [Streptomyces aurantiacus]|uniref:helix-turn-helix transcriptional regulator n=1 Tax=Streptomyces aurantiacus TaxID=47760 RepID=UPI00278F8B80|nr:helix-turn-helix transcriptional regulator [Streptomyces aurantiacus]MDQ0774970.1 transcriptional regulator with XRE-family HTH domain [Streptomyces aurantiacus]